ncbi:MAG: hypothetical protein V1811_03320, partial [Candidatus Micrarchaeota archaeon]
TENVVLLGFTGLPAVFAISFLLRLVAVYFIIPKIHVPNKPIRSRRQLFKFAIIYPVRSAMHEVHAGVLAGLKGARLVETKILKRVRK